MKYIIKQTKNITLKYRGLHLTPPPSVLRVSEEIEDLGRHTTRSKAIILSIKYFGGPMNINKSK